MDGLSRSFGSLFSGIGGFDLGLERASWQCSWQAEIDKSCNEVLAGHWPEVRRYGDIKEIRPAQLEAVDLITAGWPCQDLSIAGKRAGLAGERSGLFFQALRIIQGLKPRWFLLEQVPGLFSQNKGQDFAVVIQALTECGYGVAWRVLNSQYFGVPQRRRRVFIVGSLGDDSCAKVLFEPESSARDTSPRRETREELARDVGACLKGGSGQRGFPIEFEAGLVAAPLKASSPSRRAGGSWPIAEEFVVAATLTGRMQGQSNQWPPISEADNLVAYPVTTREGQRMEPTQDTFIIHENIGGSVTPAGHARALRSGASHNYQFILGHNKGQDFNCREYRDVSPAVTQAWGTGGGNVPFIGVRRLTPTECERLQGFPDGWTEGQADSTRYRQLGNAVTVNVAQWLGERVANQCPQE